MSTEKPEDEHSAPPSAPGEPPPEEAAAQAAERTEEPFNPDRVVDAGTSQELVIVNYADEGFLHPRHRELARPPESNEAESPEPSADAPPAPPDEPLDLEIVRDVLSPAFISTFRPKEPPPVAFEPPGAMEVAAPPEGAAATPAEAPSAPESTATPSTPAAAEADPPWMRRAPTGTYAPPPPREPSTSTLELQSDVVPPPPPPPLTPRPASTAPLSLSPPPLPPRPIAPAAPRPASSTTLTERAPSSESAVRLAPEAKKPSRELITSLDIDELFVKPDLSSKRPRPERPESKSEERPPSKAEQAAAAARPEPPPPRPERPKPARAAAPAPPPPLPPKPKRARRRPDTEVIAAPAPPRRPTRVRSEGGAPVVSTIAAVLASLAFAAACTLATLQVEPCYTWLYIFAWYPFLVVTNHFTATQSREHSLFSPRARTIASLCAWSVPVWLFFEIFNFRLENWYYVGVPDLWAARRLGIALSFATVLPGIFFLEEAQRVRGAFESRATKPFTVTPGLEKTMVRLGLLCVVLILALPTFFFPLVWGVPVLLLEPWLRRRGDSSLLGELEAGRPDRILRLLVAGMICGLFWESANFLAGGRWIYTVPGFSSGKLFEMPVLGFVGFPPFALACWSMARALVQLGLLPDWDATKGAARSNEGDDEAPAEPARKGLSKGSRLSLIAWSVLVSFLVFEGMDRWTIDSRIARPEDVPGIPDGVAQYAHRHGYHDVRSLVNLIDQGRLHIPGASSEEELATLRAHCRLVLLRGIGTANARRLEQVGVYTVEELAARDGDSLAKALQGVEAGWTPKPRRVAVWVQAAQSASRTGTTSLAH